jgi:hypothetical protein
MIVLQVAGVHSVQCRAETAAAGKQAYICSFVAFVSLVFTALI